MKYLVYSTPGCNYCTRAKNLLKNHKKDFEEINLIKDDKARHQIIEVEGHKTVPQIYVRDALGCEEYIGGFDDLHHRLEYG